MAERMMIVALVGLALVILDVFYVVIFGKMLLDVFEKKRQGEIPVWFKLMDNIASLFVETPLTAQEAREKEIIMSASAQEEFARKTYLNLKINFSPVEEEESQSSLKNHIQESKAKEKLPPVPVFKERRSKPRDIGTAQQYFNALDKAINEISKNVNGISFSRSEKMTSITEGNMRQYNLLNKIRANLVQLSGLVLKVDVKPDVKDYFTNVHYLFQSYIGSLVHGLDDLMDFIYHGDKRKLHEGQKSLSEANKLLTEIRNRLSETKL